MKLGRAWFGVFFNDGGAEGAASGAAGAGDAGAGAKDEFIPRAEAKKAFEARDRAKKEADELRRWKEEREKADAEREAKAEEDRLKQQGQWEALRKSLVEKHSTELDSERKARQALEQSYTAEKIEAAFLGATDWFGGDTAKTILTGDMANAYLGKHVSFEEVEIGGRAVKAVVVRDLDGNIIVDGKGNPARFAEAIGELIASLPNKDRILRGSGKTGSGSSGGGSHSAPVPVDVRRPLGADAFRDPKQRAAMKAQMAGAGGLQIGPAWDKAGR